MVNHQQKSAEPQGKKPTKAGLKSAALLSNASDKAMYHQIKDFVVGAILDGRWKTGDKLPSESELVQQFGVSRMTVNRALRELMVQGRIRRVAGVGSFVAEDKPQSNLLHIASLVQDIRARGHAYACEVVVVEQVAASIEIASALGLPMGEPVFHSLCVHKENGVPMQLEDRYVNPRMAPAFIDQDFLQEQPSDYLVRTVRLDELEHVVDAVLPTAEQAKRLSMPDHQPCLLLTRRTWQRGMPITLVHCLHPGDRYRLGSRFHTEG